MIMGTEASGTCYSTYYSKLSSVHRNQCIDGTITGSSNCVAFCYYEEHRGFLTEKLRSRQKCMEKGCMHYNKKPQKISRNGSIGNTEQEQILTVTKSATREMEGIRIMRASPEPCGEWTVYYVSIADYSFDSVVRDIEENIGKRVAFKNLQYRFEIAAELIFGTKTA